MSELLRNKMSELLTRNEKVKENFRVINIIGISILNECFENNLSRYRGHIMSKIIFMKCLPTAMPKLVPTLKMHRIY